MNRNQHLPHTKSIMRFFEDWKFTVFLVFMVIQNLTRMATVDDFEDRFILDLLGAVLLVAATLSLCVEKRSRTVALILGIPAIGLTFSRNLVLAGAEHFILIAGRSSSMLFLAFMIGIILRTLLTKPTVTRDSIAGAFCGYVLIAVMFAQAYCLLDALVPNSFQMGTVKTDGDEDPLLRWLMLEYFSFTTVTTLGFGDVIPVTPIARGLAVWEAICGQFYLAVLVAGLVNLRAARVTTAPNE